MFKQGPVPAFVHGVIEYLAAALFIGAPFLLSFDDDTATAVSIVVGVLILIVTASTALPTGLIKSIPVQAHAVIDFLLAAVLIASLLRFCGSSQPRVTMLAVPPGPQSTSTAVRFAAVRLSTDIRSVTHGVPLMR